MHYSRRGDALTERNAAFIAIYGGYTTTPIMGWGGLDGATTTPATEAIRETFAPRAMIVTGRVAIVHIGRMGAGGGNLLVCLLPEKRGIYTQAPYERSDACQKKLAVHKNFSCSPFR